MKGKSSEASQQIASNAFIHMEGNFACIAYSKGLFYLGQVNGQMKRQGLGILFFPRFGFYFGYFRADLANGFGCLKEPNGNQTLGNFEDGLLQGNALKYRVGSNTLRAEFYEESFLKRTGEPKTRSFNSSYDKELRDIDEEVSVFVEMIEELSSIKIMRFEDGLYFGTVKEKVPSGVGLYLKSNQTIEFGFFQNGRLSGPGRRLINDGNFFFSIFLNGIDLKVETLQLEIQKAKYIEALAENRPDFTLLEDAFFMDSSQVQKKRQKYEGSRCWFEPRVFDEGLDFWLKNFFSPLNFNGNKQIEIRSEISPINIPKNNHVTSLYFDTQRQCNLVKEAHTFVDYLSKGSRFLNETHERIKEKSLGSSRLLIERTTFPTEPDEPYKKELAKVRQRPNLKDLSLLGNRFKNDKLCSSEILNPHFGSFANKTNAPEVFQKQESKQLTSQTLFLLNSQKIKDHLRESSALSSSRTQDDTAVKDFKIPLPISSNSKNPQILLKDFLEKGKNIKSKVLVGQKTDVKLREFKSFEQREEPSKEKSFIGPIYKKVSNVSNKDQVVFGKSSRLMKR